MTTAMTQHQFDLSTLDNSTVPAAGGDLLAEVAGILEGASEGELDEPLARCAAQLCLEAGADLEAIPAWIEEGRLRRARAGLPPFSRGTRP